MQINFALDPNTGLVIHIFSCAERPHLSNVQRYFDSEIESSFFYSMQESAVDLGSGDVTDGL